MLLLPKQHPIHRQDYYYYFTSQSGHYLIGRKGSGKSAIFTLAKEQLESQGSLVIPITPMQYSWTALKEYKEVGITAEQAHTNAWIITLLSAIIWKMNEQELIPARSKLVGYYKYMKDAYVPTEEWFQNIVHKSHASSVSRSFLTESL